MVSPPRRTKGKCGPGAHRFARRPCLRLATDHRTPFAVSMRVTA